MNDNSRHDASRSRVNFDNSRIVNNNGFNQSRMSNVNALGENRNVVNRKSTVSPMINNKRQTNAINNKGMMRQ